MKKTNRFVLNILAMAIVFVQICFSSAAVAGDGTYTWPVDVNYKITSGFYAYSNHNGADFAVAIGNSVYAVADGTVIRASDNGCQGSHNSVKYGSCPLGSSCGAVINTGKSTGSYGNWIIIDHGNNVYSVYAHLKTSSFLVTQGQQVKQGQQIASSGNAGNTKSSAGNGAHLHFELRIGGNSQTYSVDPAKHLTQAHPSAAHNPFGVTDSVSGGIHSIHIRGWAFDQDDMSQSLNLHVYVGGIPYEIPANVYRPDVHNVHGCGEYHGFDATIYVDTSLVGTQTVEIYALNVGGGQHALLHSTAVNIEKDSSAPTISNVVVSDISPSGYTVTCTVTDESEISRVQFPTWTSKNGQDDLFAEWPTNPAAAGTKNGNTYTYRVNVSDHNNESGEYVTHIYAFDKYSNHDADNSIVVEVPYNDTTPPKIYSVYADDISSDGYTLYCKVSDDGAIDRVMFPTWTTYHGQDDLPNDWRDNSTVMGIENNGVYSCRVNASDHNNETGEYHTHIYAYDKAGNETCYGDFVVHLPVKAIHGDLNNDSNVTNDDVIVLLWHTLFPEENPISANADFNKDKIITNDDVLLLLWHTLFPENNPL